jgi:pimeloyl-ACP methyl ester carboxylesterase
VSDELATLIERMGLDRPIAAGQSWGGNVVLELASRHPTAVRAIALVDGGWIELSEGFPKLADCLAALAPPRLAGRPLKEVEGWIRSAHADWPESGIRGTLGNFEVRPDGTIAPWLTYDRHLVVLRGLWEHHPATRYATLQVPALLIPADDAKADWNDRKRPAVEAAQAAIPHARTSWISGDHDLHAQHPQEVAALLHEMTVDGFVP